MTLRPLHILLDADGTLYDWGARWDELLEERFPQYTNIPRTPDQRSFNLKLGLNEEESLAVDDLFNHPGFYKDLTPIPGAQEAVAKMVERGHHVQIATSPWWENPTCLQDKADSIHRDFNIRKHIIFANDKTGLRGDYLFDDKPEISGHYTKANFTTTWIQVLYDQPYNRTIDLPRIFDWSQWEDRLEELEESSFVLKLDTEDSRTYT